MPVLRICVPAKVHTNTKFVMCLLNAIPHIKARTGLTPDVKFMCGKSNIDQARSMLATDFYNQCSDDDMMLFIDSDHIYNIDDIANAVKIDADVTCGIYPNAIGKPTCYMMDPMKFLNGEDNRLRYAGTGFMMIRRPIMTKILEMFKSDPRYIPYARVSGPDYNAVIPFFKQQIIESELTPATAGQPDTRDWLGEDYTFCWYVRQCGGTIRGFFTKSLGHEVANIRIFYPDSPATKLEPQEIHRRIRDSAQSTSEPSLDTTPTLSTAGPVIPQPANEPVVEEQVIELPEDLQRLIQQKQKQTHTETNTEVAPIYDATADDNERAIVTEEPTSPTSPIPSITNSSNITAQANAQAITYFCGMSRVKFSPNDKSLGGSEQAVTNLAREWVKLGHPVTVYGNVEEGTFDGVSYKMVDKFNVNNSYPILILWRGFGLSLLPSVQKAANTKLFVDLHDCTDPRMLPSEHIDKVDHFFVKSKWHSTFWPHLPRDKFIIIPNAINVPLYRSIIAKAPKRNLMRLCYTSCYTRGLLPTLTKAWPIIKQQVPEAEFVVCYGDDLIQDLDLKNQLEQALTQPGIVHLGRIDHDQVAQLKASSNIHLYLCSAPPAETDCISIRESFYAGCIPVTFKEGVFMERQAIHVPKNHNESDAYQLAAAVVVKLLREQNILEQIRQKNQQPELEWGNIAQFWQRHF